MTTIAALIVAAGRGTRAGGGRPKQWRALAGQQLLREGTPILFYPAAALAITVLTFMMLGDVLRDALDPKARTR